MSINKIKFGEAFDKEVDCYVLDNGNGLKAEILTFGGIIKNLVYNGVDVVHGRDSMEEYMHNDGYFSALIGRNSNRIENSEFELDCRFGRFARLAPIMERGLKFSLSRLKLSEKR